MGRMAIAGCVTALVLGVLLLWYGVKLLRAWWPAKSKAKRRRAR